MARDERLLIQKKWRDKNRKNWIQFFQLIKKDVCVVCNYSDCFSAVDFHHLREDNKKFNIAKFISDKACTEANMTVLLVELRKCVSLCKVCHTELHANFGMFR